MVTAAPAAPSGVTSYPVQTAYNDGGQPTSLTYSDNEVLSYGYDGPSGWLSSLTATPAGGSATTLLGGIGYTGAGGAAGHPTSASVACGVYSYSASYDADLRLSSLSISHSGTTLFSSQRGYDAVGNVTAVGTTLAASTDNQVFCYDDQHRLTWAGSTGTPNCGASLTPGSLTAANYTQTYTYDTLDRLQSGPLGSYTYGDSAHLHAVTAIGSTYSATYDAGGNMTCRAATSSTVCSGTPTGAQLTFDNEGRLAAWQNTPTSPTTTDSFLYDGEGNRVEQQTTTNGSIITSTVYVAGGLEEITSSGASTTLTKYLGASGLPTAERVGTNGPLSYLATDGQGTISETLDGSGNVTSAQLYTPYGTVRYSSGSSPTSIGYTGQRADSATGLDYYHARYYDPVAGQFVSADTVDDGPNHYGYVGGNPTTATDPSGHRRMCDHDCGTPSGSSGGGGGGGCHSDWTCGCYSDCGGSGGQGNGSGDKCNPDSADASDACKAAAYDDDKARNDALRSLQTGALLKQIAGYLLVIIADGVDIARGNTLTTLEALLDLATTVVNSLLPLLGQVTQNLFPQFHDAVEQAERFGSHLNGLLTVLQAAIGFVRQGNWLMQVSVNVAIQIAKQAEDPIPGVLMTLAASIFGPALSSYLDSGAHFLIRSGLDDMADWQHQMSMSIVDWCAQFGKHVCPRDFPEH